RAASSARPARQRRAGQRRTERTQKTMAKVAPDISMSAPQSPAHGESSPRTPFWTLTLGSLGVVYGDIGTSPLYAFREAVMAASAGGAVTRTNVLGVLSLILWALIIVVTLKYVLLLLRADNNGE